MRTEKRWTTAPTTSTDPAPAPTWPRTVSIAGCSASTRRNDHDTVPTAAPIPSASSAPTSRAAGRDDDGREHRGREGHEPEERRGATHAGEQVGDDGRPDGRHGDDGDRLAPVAVGGDDRRRAGGDDDEAAERREQRQDEPLAAGAPDELAGEGEQDAERDRGRDPEQVLAQRAEHDRDGRDGEHDGRRRRGPRPGEQRPSPGHRESERERHAERGGIPRALGDEEGHGGDERRDDADPPDAVGAGGRQR